MTTVVIVGGGVLGTMHARAAIQRGLRVVQLEREQAARGASVRNFGLIWVSGRAAGADLELAIRARELWQEVAAEVPGVGFRPNGSLTVAQNEAEWDVLRDVGNRADAAARQFSVLDRDQAQQLNPALRGELLGALWCPADAVVEPRLAVAAIRAQLKLSADYRWLPGLEATELVDHGVVDQFGVEHCGDQVVLCTGAAHTGLVGAHVAAAGLRRVRLQMMQTEPFDTTVTTSLADGDSMRYYPAFAGETADKLPPQDPVAARYGSQLLLVQRLDGSLTIGDTHHYDEPFDFDVDEQAYDQLRARAQSLLGRELPPIRRRWAGVYSQLVPGRDEQIYHHGRVRSGVTLVTGPGGRGMTHSPAIAERTLDGLFAGRPAVVGLR